MGQGGGGAEGGWKGGRWERGREARVGGREIGGWRLERVDGRWDGGRREREDGREMRMTVLKKKGKGMKGGGGEVGQSEYCVNMFYFATISMSVVLGSCQFVVMCTAFNHYTAYTCATM